MNAVRKWWTRRRLRAQLREAENHEATLHIIKNQLVIQLNDAYSKLIIYKEDSPSYGIKLQPAREQVMSLTEKLEEATFDYNQCVQYCRNLRAALQELA